LLRVVAGAGSVVVDKMLEGRESGIMPFGDRVSGRFWLVV